MGQKISDNTKCINNEKLRLKLENWDTYCHYFLSYQINNLDSIVDSYIQFGPATFLEWIEIENYDTNDNFKRATHSKSSVYNSNSNKDELYLHDIKMELCDQIPHVDKLINSIEANIKYFIVIQVIKIWQPLESNRSY